ncbi:predicted Zn-dependent hydrolase of beta-lactamase fold [Chthonomonas calidirosea]|uniref:Predicted Zn-dependent hydrolases of the beta-lactamase fold n=1 Tax=Chthonomonas calidirosea (strain DSM 23976 / ICMP 18418 / T49) TaxID=1303518 RepID=S0EZ96_CHTCT|nr:MBL fold metallo-hydrolase [Chthonomonas calidirosea]CCW36084.1 Predicted Zn-dependent hydrolases of the beta-lactamase fold [Chthonomonas calidirosea T49]CEK18381.1 predicted Zn-dependent hydrolase of beta-lactamase fold [Chthonomonas calidirosea]
MRSESKVRVATAQTHTRLLEDIARPCDPTERGAFWWLGQHTFVVRVGALVFYIDPWFAAWESRCNPPPLTPAEGRYADFVLVTHGHGDHLCPETLRAMVQASPKALFVCPPTETERMLQEALIPAERLRPLNAGGVLEERGARITAIKSKHEFFDEKPEVGFPYLGYVVEADGLRFYHSGDTIMYEGLLSTLQQWPHFDVLFLPINGRDAERYRRGIIGNFTFQEAVELAGELRPRLVVPSHYDMFVGNQEDPTKFTQFLEAKYPGVPYWIGPIGERVSLP